MEENLSLEQKIWKKPYLLLLIGCSLEILALVCTLLSPVNAFIGLGAFIIIPAIIIEIIAYYKLRIVDETFKYSLIFISISLGISIVSLIFSVLAALFNQITLMQDLTVYFDCASALFRLVAIVFLIEETNKFVPDQKLRKFGVITTYIYIISQIFSTIISVLASAGNFTDSLYAIFVYISCSLDIIGFIFAFLYVVFIYHYIISLDPKLFDKENG